MLRMRMRSELAPREGLCSPLGGRLYAPPVGESSPPAPGFGGGGFSLRHTGTSFAPLPDPDPKAPDTGTKLGPPEGGGRKSFS